MSTQPDRTRVEAGTTPVDIESRPDEYLSAHPVLLAPDSAYLLTMGVFADLGIPVTENDPVNRVVANHAFRIRYKFAGRQLSNYYDCGSSLGSSNANTYTLYMNVSTQVVPGPNNTSTIHTQTFAKATQEGLSDAAVRCASTGRLERLLVDRVAAKAAGLR